MDKILLDRLKTVREIQERLKKEGYSFPISWDKVEKAMVYNYNEQVKHKNERSN